MTDSLPASVPPTNDGDPPVTAATVEIPVTWNDADRDAGVDWWIATCNYWHEQADTRERLRQMSGLKNEQLRGEVDRLNQAITRVLRLCADQEVYCGGAGLDVPSWVGSVRAALEGKPDAT